MLRLPSKVRWIMSEHLPSVFTLFLIFNDKLGKIVPKYGSFYFLTLEK